MKAKRSETQAGGKARRADGTAVVLERNRFSMAYAWLQDQDLKGSLFALLREYGEEPRLAMHDISLRFAGAEAELSDRNAFMLSSPVLKSVQFVILY